ncbi:MAG TPA: hypothetical protein VGL42_08890 [Opitutaceae bacterium]|jgi:hypothetical protein
MIRSLRILFLSRPTREKVLVLTLLVLAAGWWVVQFSGRASDFVAGANHTTASLKDQRYWLTNRERIERQAKAEASQLDPSRTLDGPRLSTAVTSIANENNLTYHTSDSSDAPGGQFVIHTMQFNITNAPWESLKSFYKAVEQRAPYISVETFSIASNKSNPSADQLNASLKVSSVEIKR